MNYNAKRLPQRFRPSGFDLAADLLASARGSFAAGNFLLAFEAWLTSYGRVFSLGERFLRSPPRFPEWQLPHWGLAMLRLLLFCIIVMECFFKLVAGHWVPAKFENASTLQESPFPMDHGFEPIEVVESKGQSLSGLGPLR
jgi:hypothetical protein